MGQSSAAARSAHTEENRLFNQDRLIAWNALRATFAGWPDRVIAVLMLLAALAVVGWWFGDRPWTNAAWAALGAGTMIGFAAGRLIAMRLALHAFDGLLAADALHPQTRRRYVAAWHGVGLVLLAVVALIARPSLLLASVPGYLAGVLVAAITGGFGKSVRFAGMARPGWMVRAWSHRPSAGFAAAMLLIWSLLPARTLGANASIAVIGIEAVLLALMLTGVDYAIVRFMTLAGHGPGRIIVRHGRGLVSFLAVAMPGCWVMVGSITAGIVAAAGVATLLLLTLRILAYRLHAQRFADFLVSIHAALLVLVGCSMPITFPVVAVVLLWWLHRRGRTKTWLLA